MAAVYSWDNRIKFLVRYMYDLDNNGYLNKNDFDCLAVKFTVLEGRGEWNEKRFEFNFYQQISVILRFQWDICFSFTRYSMIMSDLWDQISDIADLNKVRKIPNNQVRVEDMYRKYKIYALSILSTSHWRFFTKILRGFQVPIHLSAPENHARSFMKELQCSPHYESSFK